MWGGPFTRAYFLPQVLHRDALEATLEPGLNVFPLLRDFEFNCNVMAA